MITSEFPKMVLQSRVFININFISGSYHIICTSSSQILKLTEQKWNKTIVKKSLLIQPRTVIGQKYPALEKRIVMFYWNKILIMRFTF